MSEPQRDALVILTTYVSEDLKNDIVALAEAAERSIAAEIRLALRRHVDAARATA